MAQAYDRFPDLLTGEVRPVLTVVEILVKRPTELGATCFIGFE